jgi:glutathione reductase (NADPH)
MKKYDVFVIGSGMAGAAVAKKCAKEGLKTAISDMRPYGGTCALRGCDPKKVLVDAAVLREKVMQHIGKGIEGEANINWQELMKFKESFTDPVPDKMEHGYEKAGIHTYHSKVSFEDEKTLLVGEEKIAADKIIIVTGARPREMDIPGKEYTIDSTEFLNLKELPKQVTFIGGGYISFEFAHLAARAGAKVTIIDHGPQPLKKFEKDIVAHVLRVSEEAGIEIKLNTEVQEITKHGNTFKLNLKNDKNLVTLETELAVCAIGRVPEVDELNLSKGNVNTTEKGIEVDEYLQSTSNSRVFAAGDVADTAGLPLTPVAVYEGHVLASNVIQSRSKKVNYPEIPTVVFTIPAMASVGLTEEQAKEQNLNFKIKSGDAKEWYNGRRTQASAYAYKILIDKDKNTLLGAHLVGPHAEETINILALAIKAGISVNTLKSFPFSYPTMASDIAYMV